MWCLQDSNNVHFPPSSIKTSVVIWGTSTHGFITVTILCLENRGVPFMYGIFVLTANKLSIIPLTQKDGTEPKGTESFQEKLKGLWNLIPLTSITLNTLSFLIQFPNIPFNTAPATHPPFLHFTASQPTQYLLGSRPALLYSLHPLCWSAPPGYDVSVSLCCCKQ